jgi:hypothetical protein
MGFRLSTTTSCAFERQAGRSLVTLWSQTLADCLGWIVPNVAVYPSEIVSHLDSRGLRGRGRTGTAGVRVLPPEQIGTAGRGVRSFPLPLRSVKDRYRPTY